MTPQARAKASGLTNNSETDRPRANAMNTNDSHGQPFDDLPEFLSPEEFWRFLRIGRSTVYDLLRRNEIPHVRFGRVIRIPKSAIPRG